MTPNDFLVDAKGLHAWYASSHVLHGIDIKIARGQTMGLLGRNGMGKRTLIRTLLGHVTQRAGSITLFGEDASKFKPHQVARLGVAYVPEGRGVFPNLTVRENLLMSARPGGDGRMCRQAAATASSCRARTLHALNTPKCVHYPQHLALIQLLMGPLGAGRLSTGRLSTGRLSTGRLSGLPL